jgi:hypothetical protein
MLIITFAPFMHAHLQVDHMPMAYSPSIDTQNNIVMVWEQTDDLTNKCLPNNITFEPSNSFPKFDMPRYTREKVSLSYILKPDRRYQPFLWRHCRGSKIISILVRLLETLLASFTSIVVY